MLPLLQTGEPGLPGEAAPGVQAYCFRLCLTTNANRIPIARPAGYDPGRYELVARFIAACQAIGDDMDGVLTAETLLAWEAKHGRVPQGAAVFLRTGWEDRIGDKVAYMNDGGPLRFPGFGPDAARILVDERGAVGLGIDTLGIDAGNMRRCTSTARWTCR